VQRQLVCPSSGKGPEGPTHVGGRADLSMVIGACGPLVTGVCKGVVARFCIVANGGPRRSVI
jgi:hypothetical protein